MAGHTASEEYRSEQQYLDIAARRCVLPEGFRSATASLSFTPGERPTAEPYSMNLALFLADEPMSAYAGVFTRNAVAGAPVQLARERMDGSPISGVLVNNRIANVCSQSGMADARRLTEALGSQLGRRAEELLSVSTGIIGWSLPTEAMIASFPGLEEQLHDGDALAAARAIMTTDSFPKARSVRLGEGSLLGIAKGAGMVEPNMATMLVFLFTDVSVDRETLQSLLSRVSERTFNRITIDGDQSTSDMALAFSSARKPAVDAAELEEALVEVCGRLADDIVRNGEGTAHVMRVHVSGMEREADATGMAKAVANSPLVKTAIYGNDPNVGRIIAAVGDYAGNHGLRIDTERITVYLGRETVFADGAFRLDREKEVRLSDYVKSTAMNPRVRGYPQHDRCVDIHIDFALGSEASTVLGSDLSDEYVHENADYRS
jgi:glutamate N-acetyltransferase/amino-acid N-acetyltransferase